LDKELEQSTEKAWTLEADLTSLKSQSTASEMAYKKDLEHLNDALKATQAKELSSTAKVGVLEKMNRSLQMESLTARASKLQAMALADADLERLKQQLAGAQDSLRQHKAAHRKLMREHIHEKEQLQETLDYLKGAFDMLMGNVNESGHCRGCRRHWNFTLDHDKYRAIKMSCELCHNDSWYY
jgi:hypothetical protein